MRPSPRRPKATSGYEVTQADGQLRMSVQDSGIGIAPEMVPHIFELFVQERQAVARAEGGLGIGLTIVRSLVELHGGSVSVRSNGVGTGTEFIVRLPAAATEPDECAPHPRFRDRIALPTFGGQRSRQGRGGTGKSSRFRCVDG